MESMRNSLDAYYDLMENSSPKTSDFHLVLGLLQDERSDYQSRGEPLLPELSQALEHMDILLGGDCLPGDEDALFEVAKRGEILTASAGEMLKVEDYGLVDPGNLAGITAEFRFLYKKLTGLRMGEFDIEKFPDDPDSKKILQSHINMLKRAKSLEEECAGRDESL